VAVCLASVGLSLPHICWTAHISGWVTQGVVFVIIIAQFVNSQKTCEFQDAPDGGAIHEFAVRQKSITYDEL
jgi:hypothetical protein